MSGEIFSGFTNKYEVSKTLRFELKAIAETQRLLEENNVFKKAIRHRPRQKCCV